MDWTNIIPTLSGTIIGGVITWKVTKKSLKKTFDFEMKLKKINDLRMILKALTTIRRELRFNTAIIEININRINEEIEEEKIYIKNKFNNLNDIAWEKFNYELVDFELKGEIEKLTYFYCRVIRIIEGEYIKKESLKEIHKVGKESIEILDKNIEFIKTEINKLEK